MKRPKQDRRTPKLPPTIVAAIERMRDQLALAEQHARKERPYYLNVGEAWYAVKDDPELDNIGGIKALKLPRTPQFLNRCAVAWDGHQTGDLEKGERWVAATGYKLRNVQEPYLAAEIVEAYRKRNNPRRTHNRIPLALTEGRIFVRNSKVSFAGAGSAVLGNCDVTLPNIPDGVIDCIITDPTFGVLGARGWKGQGKLDQEWDKPLNWERLWPELWRVLKPSGTIIIASMEPLTAELIHAQIDHYLYSWYWRRRPSDIFNPSVGRPLGVIEPIPVFSQARHGERTYNPQTVPLKKVINRLSPLKGGLHLLSSKVAAPNLPARLQYHEENPTNLIEVEPSEYDNPRIMHAQKPVNLFRCLVRTHTDAGDVVLDIAAGGFTTAVACILEDRKFICIEKDRRHFALGTRRVRALLNSKTTKAAK
jgi:site-specific DNA-methyltransferase (adenine-specific)